ncbi:MAG: glycosyltransferase, partial [Acidimicrobiales bacterium]
MARWATEVTRALLGRHRDLIGAIRFDASLPPPADAGDLLESGLGTTAGPEAGICHVMGPFDSGDSVERMWPRQRPPLRLVVTVYDLIPELMPETYLSDPGVRARYRARRHLVRAADAVVTLSRASAGDIVERLGVDPRRVHVAGASCSVVFRPPASREQAVSEARRAVPGLGRRWVAYNGAVEPRKNVESLLEAYARLPRPVREGCDLVLACAMDELQRNHYQVRSAALGVAAHVRLTGFVEDAVLARIYQGAEVVVCPSLYEGYGLPVAEALSCGAPVLASGNSAMAELVAPGATLDPTSLDAITGSLTRALSDESWRDELRRWAHRPQPTWDGVASRVADVYGSLLGSKAGGRRRAPRVALVTPWPPQRTGVADYSAHLVAALDGKVEVDVFVDGDEPGDERLPGTGPPL